MPLSKTDSRGERLHLEGDVAALVQGGVPVPAGSLDGARLAQPVQQRLPQEDAQDALRSFSIIALYAANQDPAG